MIRLVYGLASREPRVVVVKWERLAETKDETGTVSKNRKNAFAALPLSPHSPPSSLSSWQTYT
jgi:hypothetical protein